MSISRRGFLSGAALVGATAATGAGIDVGPTGMRYLIYTPTVTSSNIVNPYGDPEGLTYTSNPSMAYYAGMYWVIFDGTTQGFSENSVGQQIWLITSTDAKTWTVATQPFRDSNFCNNPVTNGSQSSDYRPSLVDMQPNLIVVGSELWCTWNGVAPPCTYISKLTSPTSKWQNYRFEFAGDQPYLSSRITGATTSGKTLHSDFDGVTDWLAFMTQTPIILSNGVVACPTTFISYDRKSVQTSATSAFIQALKQNGLLCTTNGTDWTMIRIDTSEFGDFCAWEPFVVEDHAGYVYAYSRNLNAMSADDDYLLIALSVDGGASFAPSESTEMLVPSTRGFARKVSDSRWIMTHCDHPALSSRTPDASEPFSRRANGALFVSRRGSNDFVPGVNFSGEDRSVNYPQFIIDSERKIHVVYTSGVALGKSNRRQLKHVTIDRLPDDDYAYVHPRSVNAYNPPNVEIPVLRTSTPPRFYFNGMSQISSTRSLAASVGVSYVSWLTQYDGSTIMDSRQFSEKAPGHVLYWAGLAISGIDFYPSDWSLKQSHPTFIAATVDNSGTVNLWYGDGGKSLNQATGYFKSLYFIGQPADGDVLTVDSGSYNFRTRAVLNSDIVIGATVSDTVGNTNLKLRANSLKTAIPSSNRLLIARTDLSKVAVTSGSLRVVAEVTIPVAGGPVLFGKPVPASSASSLAGEIFDARAYDTPLTAANVTNLYNARAPEFGYAAINGTSIAPGDPRIKLDATAPDFTEFPSLADANVTATAYCEVISEVSLRIHGEGSASVELPYDKTRINIRYKLGATPAGTDRYTIATFGTAASPARLYIDSKRPNSLYCNGQYVSSIGSSTTAVNTVVVAVHEGHIVVGDFKHSFSGEARCFLGSAYPENLLDPTKTIDYDVSAMTAERL